MLYFNKIDVSEGIDVNKTRATKWLKYMSRFIHDVYET